MQRESIHVVVALLQNFAIPLEVRWHKRAAGAARDQLHRMIHIAHLARSILGFHPVLCRGDMSDLPWPIHLISNAPVLHVVGFGIPVLSA